MTVALYALLTWTTRNRAELIDVAGAEFLRAFLPKAAHRHGAMVVDSGIVRNHVHLLLFLSASVNIPSLVQRLKGASGRIANRDHIMGNVRLRWAKGYDLRSVSPRAVPMVRAYLARQEHRHPLLAIDGAPHAGGRIEPANGGDNASGAVAARTEGGAELKKT